MPNKIPLHLFKLPKQVPVDLGEFIYWKDDTTIGFTAEASAVGVYPVYYTHTTKNDLPPHTHDFFEIFLVLSGSGSHWVEEQKVPIAKGDIVFVNNQKKHTLASDKSGMQILNLCFLPFAIGYNDETLRNNNLLSFYTLLTPFLGTDRDAGCIKLKPSENFFQKITFDGLHLMELFFEDRVQNREIIQQLLKTVILLLFKEYKDQFPSPTGEKLFLLDALNLIRERYAQKISLEQIASHYGINKTTFSTLFNKVVGKNLNEYINEFRVEKAKELLLQTRLPVSAVAMETGFENMSHFSFVFKKTSGLSPRQFQKRANE